MDISPAWVLVTWRKGSVKSTCVIAGPIPIVSEGCPFEELEGRSSVGLLVFASTGSAPESSFVTRGI